MGSREENAAAVLAIMQRWDWQFCDPDGCVWPEPKDLSHVVNRLAMEGVSHPQNAILTLLRQGAIRAKASYSWRKFEHGRHYQMQGEAAEIPLSRWQQLQAAIDTEWDYLSDKNWTEPDLEKLGMGKIWPYEWDALAERFHLALVIKASSEPFTSYSEEWYSVWDIQISPIEPEPEVEPAQLTVAPLPMLFSPPVDALPAKIGAPRKWDWDGALLHLAALAHHAPDGLLRPDGGDPNQSDIAGHLRGWFIDQTGNAPSDSLLRGYGAKFVAELNALKLKAADNP